MGNCTSTSKNVSEKKSYESSNSNTSSSSSSSSDKTTSESGYSSNADSSKSEPKKKYKFLLVGAGEAGKSTFFKIVTNRAAGMYESETDLMEFRESIRENIVEAFKTILNTCNELKVYTNDDGKEFDCRISEMLEDEVEMVHNLDAEEIDSSSLESMKKLLADEGFDTCLNKLRHMYYMPDGSLYFFDHLDRICTEDYVPNFQDILNCRDRTTGVTHEEFEYKYKGKPYILDLYDVGGQRAERKAWKKIFDNVSTILFVTSISEFDQVCIEDNTTNRSVESMMVLRVLNDSPNFVKTPILLLITKVDQLENKLKSGRKFDLRPPENGMITFDPYDGTGEIDDVKDYLLKVFLQQISGDKVVVPTFKNLVSEGVTFHEEFDKIMEAILKNEAAKK